MFEDERDARKLAEERALRARLAEQETKSHVSLDDLFSRIEEGKQTDLNLIVKADVQGSIEALRDAFEKMDQSEVRINIVHSAVGGITETDVTLASASDAIIIGFNVRPTGKSKVQAEKEKVDIRLYLSLIHILVEIPQGATVAKFAELIGVQPNDVIKRLFMLGQVLTLTQSMGDDLVELIADEMCIRDRAKPSASSRATSCTSLPWRARPRAQSPRGRWCSWATTRAIQPTTW